MEVAAGHRTIKGPRIVNPLERNPAQQDTRGYSFTWSNHRLIGSDVGHYTGVHMSSLLRNNVGTVDRGLRLLLGVGLLSLAFTGPQTPWGYLGFIPLLTGAFGTCPLYSMLGFSTCPAKRG